MKTKVRSRVVRFRAREVIHFDQEITVSGRDLECLENAIENEDDDDLSSILDECVNRADISDSCDFEVVFADFVKPETKKKRAP